METKSKDHSLFLSDSIHDINALYVVQLGIGDTAPEPARAQIFHDWQEEISQCCEMVINDLNDRWSTEILQACVKSLQFKMAKPEVKPNAS